MQRRESDETSGGERFRLLMLGGLTLLRPDGTEDPGLVARGRKLVLLAYLALSRRALARDQLATFLWGHRDDERARHSLRDALSVLRQVLGATIPRGRDVIGLAADAPLDVDVLELRAAARAGDHSAVVALYRGPFLDGVHIGDASEVEHWISEERRATERLFVAACAVECPRLAEANDWDGSAELARRWLAADPTDPAALVYYIRAIAAADTPAALRLANAEYQRHTALLAREYDEAPGATVLALHAELSDRLARAREPIIVEHNAAISSPAEVPGAPETRRLTPRVSRPIIAAAAVTVIALVLLPFMRRARPADAGTDSAQLVVAGIESPS